VAVGGASATVTSETAVATVDAVAVKGASVTAATAAVATELLTLL
jgi:hypothetical protein